MEYISPIISAIGTILVAWFSYNQYTKNKMTDKKIEDLKIAEKERNEKRADASSKIYGMLWELLYAIDASRVYIIQPHPLTNNIFLTVRIEVKAGGISGMTEVINRFDMSDVAGFVSELAKRDLILYKDVVTEMKDDRARSIFSLNGTRSIIAKRLLNDEGVWNGTIICDFMNNGEHSAIDATNTFVYTKGLLTEAASNIQYILPEIREDERVA